MGKHNRSSSRHLAPSLQQSGSTFIGIVLGLVVGLIIAVVVALYITRSPTPFVEKNASHAASGAIAASADFDPNRVLQGKTPSQPVQAGQAGQIGQGQGQAPAPASGLLEEPQIVQVPPLLESSGTPEAGAATTAPPPPPRKTPPAAVATPPAGASVTPRNTNTNNDQIPGYFLQVGAYRTQADAEVQRARLALQGFESKVSRREAGSTTYFRVRIGPFAKFEEMNFARQRLSDAGIDTAVIRSTAK